MDEALLRQLVRQLKFINFWITTFGILFLATFAILAYFLFKGVTYIHDSANKITNAQQQVTKSLDVTQQLCSDKTLSQYLGSSGVCK